MNKTKRKQLEQELKELEQSQALGWTSGTQREIEELRKLLNEQ